MGFWEPAKWVLRLRDANPENRAVLKTEMGAGHGGPSGRYDAWRDEAQVLAWVLNEITPDSLNSVSVKDQHERRGQRRGKTTRCPLTVTEALEGEPSVIRELPVMTSDLSWP